MLKFGRFSSPDSLSEIIRYLKIYLKVFPSFRNHGGSGAAHIMGNRKQSEVVKDSMGPPSDSYGQN